MMGTNENPKTLNPRAGPKPNKKPEQPSSLKGGIGKPNTFKSLLSREPRHSMPEPPHLQSSKSTTNTSTHTVNTNTTNTTNTINTVNTVNTNTTSTTIIHPQHVQKQAGQVSDDRRDPSLVALEKHLLEQLDTRDIVTGKDGVLLFNVNQVAYIVEQSNTPAKEYKARQHIVDANPPLKIVPTRCAHLGKGEFSMLKPLRVDHTTVGTSFVVKKQRKNIKIKFGLCQCMTQINIDMFFVLVYGGSATICKTG